MRQIRSNIFETNSSSSHSFWIMTKNEYDDDTIDIGFSSLMSSFNDEELYFLNSKKNKINFLFSSMFYYWDEFYSFYSFLNEKEECFPVDITNYIKNNEHFIKNNKMFKYLLKLLGISYEKVKFLLHGNVNYVDEHSFELVSTIITYYNNFNYKKIKYIINLILDDNCIICTGDDWCQSEEYIKTRCPYYIQRGLKKINIHKNNINL